MTANTTDLARDLSEGIANGRYAVGTLLQRDLDGGLLDDRRKRPAQVGNVVMWAYIAGAFGHLLAGQLVDRIGRKITCAGFYSIAALAIIGLFHTDTTAGQYFWHITTVFFFNCAIGATHVYASELFPTELRATGYGWTTNLFGRITEVAIPYLIGQLIPFMGISWGITWVAIGPIIGALLVMKYAPETRGLTLEQIQEKLDASSAKPAAIPGGARQRSVL